MKITNPDWHPNAWSQLTTSQRSNLRRLVIGPVKPTHARQKQSLDSLVRHGLAVAEGESYVASDLAKEWHRRGYF